MVEVEKKRVTVVIKLSDSRDTALRSVKSPDGQAGPAEVDTTGSTDHVVAASVLLYGGLTLDERHN